MTRTLLINLNLWDGFADRAFAGVAVLLDGDDISWAGARSDAPVRRGEDIEQIDCRGGTLLPGLIDAHVHLGMRRPPAGEPVEAALAQAARALGAGLTSVRDLGAADHSVIAAARAIAEGREAGPHIVAAGRPVALPGGYMPGLAVESDSPEGVRAAVRSQVSAGAGVIKVIASPVPPAGVVVPRSFGLENLRAAAAEAHDAGLRITAHAHGLDGARDAVRAGFDCIEHGYRLDAATIADMARRRTWLVPTLVAMEASQAPFLKPGVPDAQASRARERWEAAAEAARTAHASGVRIATGTDAPSIVPIDSIRREVVLLVEAAGFTPAAALRAATSAAAELLGIPDAGIIAAGQRADLLLVDGDPLADPAVLSRTLAVWRSGTLVSRPR
jgi:imidazolonepropionase-like amidohydrolase